MITSSTASFLTGGTEPDQRFHVKADTAVAARCNRDRKRDQFFGLPVQGTVAASRLRQRREGRMRGFDRDLIRGGHYESWVPRKQAEHMAAPTIAAK